MNASHDTLMYGRCSRPSEAGAGSGPTALPCFAELQVPVLDGYGTVKITSGPKCIANIRRNGYTSMLAKKHGTSRGFTQKVSLSCSSMCRGAFTNVNKTGWGKKIAYCIAFSVDGATDVTRRYVRNPAQHGLDRTRCPEEVLLWIMLEIRRLRRENIDKETRRRLMLEDDREEKELRSYVAQSLTAEMVSSLPGARSNDTRGDEVKTLAARQSGNVEWINDRGENGMGAGQSHDSR